MKTTASTSGVTPYVDMNTESVDAPNWLDGIAEAKIAALGTRRRTTRSGARSARSRPTPNLL